MHINLNKYKASKLVAIKWILNRPSLPINLRITRVSSMMGIPCIVVAYWAGEEVGWTEETVKYIERMIKFYKYTKIIGKPENSPV